jgi:L,D-transpeptidase ErfK/SrfK
MTDRPRHRHLSLCLHAWLWLFAPAALAESFTPVGDVIGYTQTYITKAEDTLYDIARNKDIGIVELLAANPGVDPWQPPSGTVLTLASSHVLPSIRKGIVINLPELRLFYFAPGGKVMSFPIGIGQEGWKTPTGTTRIVKKRKNPSWVPPASIRKEDPELPAIVPPGEDNPMGEYAMNLGWPSYAIHGTNRPYGIGKRSSHGCIRMYPEDIAMFYETVKEGTPVTVIDEPYKIGWKNNLLYLEVTPRQDETDVIAEYKTLPPPLDAKKIAEQVRTMAGPKAVIDVESMDAAIIRRSGIPTIIGSRD